MDKALSQSLWVTHPANTFTLDFWPLEARENKLLWSQTLWPCVTATLGNGHGAQGAGTKHGVWAARAHLRLPRELGTPAEESELAPAEHSINGCHGWGPQAERGLGLAPTEQPAQAVSAAETPRAGL